MDEKMKYFEVCFGNEESICIRGLRKPDIAEAKEFLADDIRKFSLEDVTDIYELTSEEAHSAFDFEDEEQYPVFGLPESDTEMEEQEK